jgi:hypothetical protein
MTDKNDNAEPRTKYERILDIQLEDAELMLERRKVLAAHEDELHEGRLRQAAAADDHNSDLPELRAIELVERQARARADEDVVDYRAKTLVFMATAEQRNDRWIAALERMTDACERDAEAQGRIASALENLLGRLGGA